MRRGRVHPAHLVGWPVVLLLWFGPGGPAAPPSAEGARSPLRRLLGPVAELAANVQWIRFQEARLAGRHELALARAESALELAPEDAGGWELLAGHYGFFLSAPQREEDPARRLHWFRAALEVLDRGMASSRDPARLWQLRAAFFVTKVDDDPELPWPGGVDAMQREAVRAFEEAARRKAAADKQGE